MIWPDCVLLIIFGISIPGQAISDEVVAGLRSCVANENKLSSKERFDFESVLDQCGFHYKENLLSPSDQTKPLWEVIFD